MVGEKLFNISTAVSVKLHFVSLALTYKSISASLVSARKVYSRFGLSIRFILRALKVGRVHRAFISTISWPFLYVLDRERLWNIRGMSFRHINLYMPIYLISYNDGDQLHQTVWLRDIFEYLFCYDFGCNWNLLGFFALGQKLGWNSFVTNDYSTDLDEWVFNFRIIILRMT